MKRLSVVFGALVAALLTMLWSASAAEAACYPQPVVNVSVNHQTITGGQPIRAVASSNIDCDWTLRFGSQVAKGHGKRFAHTFSTPSVKQNTARHLRATCTFQDANGSLSSCPADPIVRTIGVTLVPKHHGANGGPNHPGTIAPGGGTPSTGGGLLPNTGGPAFWVLIAGLVLLLGGGATLIGSRRRAGAQ